MLVASGQSWTVLALTELMEHHVHQFNGLHVLRNGTARLEVPGAKRRHIGAAHDVARIAVKALLDRPLNVVELVRIGGSACVSRRQHALGASVEV